MHYDWLRGLFAVDRWFHHESCAVALDTTSLPIRAGKSQTPITCTHLRLCCESPSDSRDAGVDVMARFRWRCVLKEKAQENYAKTRLDSRFGSVCVSQRVGAADLHGERNLEDRFVGILRKYASGPDRSQWRYSRNANAVDLRSDRPAHLSRGQGGRHSFIQRRGLQELSGRRQGTGWAHPYWACGNRGG